MRFRIAGGLFPGVFALVNGLAAEGILTSDDAQWVRETNDHANAAYRDPSSVVADCYDPIANPGARSWFKATAEELLTLTRGYLELLARYDVRWVEPRTDSPGRITYEDDVQVVAVPFVYPDGWPFRT
ncbi:hypothetical protein [Microbacterium mitrae]|uniref:hypothetical protein n=1 Tax=Microbacterium mitrae TaxID=664640 RepID=UPI001FE63ED4|nr:hypothetical protein [Microbacterium mitrae]